MVKLNKEEDLLWSKIYKNLMHEDWYKFLHPILNHQKMAEIFEFIHKNENKITPSFRDIFAPFDIFSPKDLKFVVVGNTPDRYVPENNNGLAYSFKDKDKGWMPLATKNFYKSIANCEFLSLNREIYSKKYKYYYKMKHELNVMEHNMEKNSHVDPTLMNEYLTLSNEMECLAETLDMEWYKEGEKYAYPVHKLASQGVLLMNMVPTVYQYRTTGIEGIGEHLKVWLWFTEEVLKLISSKMNNIVFLAFEDIAYHSIDTYISKEKHKVILCKEDKNLIDTYFTNEVNEYITKRRGAEKAIDFSIINKNNVQKF